VAGETDDMRAFLQQHGWAVVNNIATSPEQVNTIWSRSVNVALDDMMWAPDWVGRSEWHDLY
jgi:hypothetical protein